VKLSGLYIDDERGNAIAQTPRPLDRFRSGANRPARVNAVATGRAFLTSSAAADGAHSPCGRQRPGLLRPRRRTLKCPRTRGPRPDRPHDPIYISAKPGFVSRIIASSNVSLCFSAGMGPPTESDLAL